jgi:hypothetical protein
LSVVLAFLLSLARWGLLLAGFGAAMAASAQAREVTVRAIDMGRHGRLILDFDRPTKVAARAGNGVLVLAFSEPTNIRMERVAQELPGYVSTVRRDPDRTGLRLALAGRFRPNVLEAGEKVFVDLLPESWTGPPPSLPPEVVAELARRALAAEEKMREEARSRPEPSARPMTLRVSTLPTLTRLVFSAPDGVPVAFSTKDGAADLAFGAPFTLTADGDRAQLSPAVTGLATDPGPKSLGIRLTLGPGYAARGFREDDTYVVDVEKPKALTEGSGAEGITLSQPTVKPGKTPPRIDAKPVAPKGNAAAEPARPEPAKPGSGKQDAVTPEAPRGEPPRQETARPEPVRPEPVKASGPVRPTVAVLPDGLRLTFPFSARTPAAAFERGGIVTAVFHTAEPIELAGLPIDAVPVATLRGVVREGAFAIVRLAAQSQEVVRFAPQGNSWVLTLGAVGTTPSEPLAPRRAIDGQGRSTVTVPLADASGVHWIESGGERLAVATAFGPSRGLPKAQRFVEFTLNATAHGVAVLAEADDLIVRSGPDGVTIAREGGLAVSLPNASADGAAAQLLDPVIKREDWARDQLGDVLQGQRERMAAVSDAPRSGRARARLALARYLAANGLNHEAASVLAYAGAEDPSLSRQKPYLMLRSIVAARAGRAVEARRLLTSELLGEDPEALLWRAALDARARAFAPALVGFRRSAALLDLYPDDLQAEMRLLAARSALEMRDLAFAERELTAVGQLYGETVNRDEADLLRARIDEASGRPDVALDAYHRLAEEARRPVAAEAALRFVDRAQADKAITPAEAVARLETLSVTWRGDDIEVGTLGRLGRLYAEAQRWREAFMMARRANRIFPDHPVTRVLHDETARLFEELFLEGRGESLSRLDALALYFDFKEFTPIGRKGDEIVRRLADRLVALDLLEPAGDLLQHQIDHRITGAARATVAARLATIRLMAEKPLQALQALQATRLPELPGAVKRARMLLEARALSDLSRTDLALEVLRDEAGPEIDRLRADILWTGRRWREAGEAHEGIVGERWRGAQALTDQDRRDVMRAALAYGLGDEALGLDRLRAKFAGKMSDSADARTFGFLTAPNAAGTRAFRELARSATTADTLSDFLAEYRRRYPEAATAERPRPATPRPDPAAEAPRADAAQGAPGRG